MRVRRIAWSIGLLVGFLFVRPDAASACSPPFEEPTIAALGPGQVVVVGMTGERVAGGRLFHVQRSFNLGGAGTPILIAFKEGPAVGDCSYPMGVGVPLIIAPQMDPNGGLSANLSTLQADPSSELGRRYLDEAIRLFGPGVVPPAGAETSDPSSTTAEAWPIPDVTIIVALLGLAVAATFVGVVLVDRHLRARTPPEG